MGLVPRSKPIINSTSTRTVVLVLVLYLYLYLYSFKFPTSKKNYGDIVSVQKNELLLIYTSHDLSP